MISPKNNLHRKTLFQVALTISYCVAFKTSEHSHLFAAFFKMSAFMYFYTN